jgi:hypothetical protein
MPTRALVYGAAIVTQLLRLPAARDALRLRVGPRRRARGEKRTRRPTGYVAQRHLRHSTTANVVCPPGHGARRRSWSSPIPTSTCPSLLRPDIGAPVGHGHAARQHGDVARTTASWPLSFDRLYDRRNAINFTATPWPAVRRTGGQRAAVSGSPVGLGHGGDEYGPGCGAQVKLRVRYRLISVC